MRSASSGSSSSSGRGWPARRGRPRARGAASAAPPSADRLVQLVQLLGRPSPTRPRWPASPSRAQMRAPGSRGWRAGREGCERRRQRKPRAARLLPFGGLDRLPVGDHLLDAADRDVAEDVGVAAARSWSRGCGTHRSGRTHPPRPPAGRGARPGGTGRPAPRPGRPVFHARWRPASRRPPRAGRAAGCDGPGAGPTDTHRARGVGR